MLQFSQDGGPLAGYARRADRSLIVGVLLSVTLHALVILVFFTAAAGQGGRMRTVARAAPETTVVFLSASAPEPGSSRRDNPAPVMSVDAPTPASASASPVRAVALAAAAPASSQSTGTTGVGAGAVTPSTALVPVADPALGEDYRRRLQAHIAGYRRSPDRAAGGLVQVQLAIGRDGDVLAVAVASSSGVAELDDEAIATIWRARPMPPIPQALPSRLVVTLPVSFDQKRMATGQATWP